MTSVIELCCGYGGATRGMLDAGLTIERAYDIWPVAVAQHHDWLPDVPCEVRDVATITPEELAGRFVWSSLPCQPWSRANVVKATRGKNHPHYYSLTHFAWQIQHARCAVLENVPGLVENRDGQAELRELEQACVQLGLTMTVHLVSSNWFDVAQERRRVFIVIGRALPLILIQPHAAVRPESNAVTCHSGGYNVFSGKQRKVQAAVLASEYKGRTGEVTSAAGIARSIEQCAELQGVPVPSAALSKKDQYTLVGNVVPPKLACAIAQQVFVPLLGRQEAAD
ncbi:hypothetical protein GO986_08700 [Deinococcus sp. HMF7620]|uniref:DNA (cytosine-5-)-methyltransferase n=1 Tax=Deinococcus arboris TaxID=2682977 RepID=A0A7C9LQT2_9DEIO|nr:DNA cytosine methyltransferase [Deinococcus arboris]MVN86841.1 hypothetical protein [Deinococcus arboris]